jgi:hypothetical protein
MGIADSHSIFIQAADTYMHISTSTVDLVHALAQPSSQFGYGRGLAPWCLDRPTHGSFDNPNYWGCGMHIFNFTNDPPAWQPEAANRSQLDPVGLGLSKVHTTLEFVEDDGNSIAVLAPQNVRPDLDYSASSFGVSTQCQYVSNSSCSLKQSSSPISTGRADAEIGLNVSGTIYGYAEMIAQLDFHRYIHEPPPFVMNFSVTQDIIDQAANLNDDKAGTVFSNPWRSLAALNIIPDAYDTMNISDSDGRVFRGQSNYFLLLCNNTGEHRHFEISYYVQIQRLTASSLGPQLHRGQWPGDKCFESQKQ